MQVMSKRKALTDFRLDSISPMSLRGHMLIITAWAGGGHLGWRLTKIQSHFPNAMEHIP
jgi:hypothetical protein